MAILGKWSGGTVAVLPGVAYSAPAALFPVEDRNTGSAYSWNSSTSTLTLPATIVPDGFLLIGAVELEDTSNGRVNILSKIVQASGTGTVIQGRSTGFSRDDSEDRSYSRCWTFVDNPSGSSTFQYQWRRDADAPTGGTVRSEFEVVPLYYSDWGGYTSVSTAAAGGTTPTIIPGFSGTDGANISIASNVVTLSGVGKRYLCLGGWNFLGLGPNRTQRWGGFRIGGAMDDSSKSYAYSRDNSNDLAGGIFTNIVERVGSDVAVDMFIYRGDGVLSGEGGALVDSNTTSVTGVHGMVFLELYDNCQVFKSTGSTNQNIATTGPVDLAVSKVADIDINDAASFTRGTDIGMNATVACDVLLGANVGAASQAGANTARFTGYAELTVNGVEDPDSFDGSYLRGVSIGEDTLGWGANLLGFQALASGQDVGVSCTELAGSEGHGGAVHVQSGWLGFWGINLDTMEEGGTTGSGAGDLPTMEGDGAGNQFFTGSGSGDLPTLEGDGAGRQKISGAGAGDLPTVEGGGAGTQYFTGSGAGDLPVMEGATGATATARSTRTGVQFLIQRPIDAEPNALLRDSRNALQVLALRDVIRAVRNTRGAAQILVQTESYAFLGGVGGQVLVDAGSGSVTSLRGTRGGAQVFAAKPPPAVSGDALHTRQGVQVFARYLPSADVVSSTFGATPPAILKHDYSFSTTTSSRWETSISASVESIAEERVGQIGRRPTLTVGATLTGLSETMVSHIQGYLRERASGNSLSALYSDRTELTADAVASTIIECDTRWRRLFVGQTVFVTPPTFDSKTVVGPGEAGTIAKIEDDRLTLGSTITAPAGSFVYPMIDTGAVGQSSDAIDTTRFTRAKIEFTELPGASSLPSTSERIPDGVEVFDGHPVLPGCIDWTNPIPQRVNFAGEQYRIGNALVTVQRGDRAIVVTELRIVSMSRRDAWKTIQTFDYCKGRLLPFWVISPTNFVRLISTVTTTLLEIESDHTLAFLQAHVKALAVGYNDYTTKLAKVVSIQEVLGVQQIQLDRSIDVADIVFVEPAYLSRSSFDTLTEEWLTLEHMVTTITTTDLLDEREIPFTVSGIQ